MDLSPPLLDPNPTILLPRYLYLLQRRRNYARHRYQAPTSYILRQLPGEFNLDDWNDENIRRCFRFTRAQLS
jgi:hypothetical protein